MGVPIRPLEDKVIVKVVEPETVTASGLVLPDAAAEKTQQGEIVAVGPGALGKDGERVALDVKVGETVLFGKYGGTEVKYSGEEYLVLTARDLLAVIEK